MKSFAIIAFFAAFTCAMDISQPVKRDAEDDLSSGNKRQRMASASGNPFGNSDDQLQGLLDLPLNLLEHLIETVNFAGCKIFAAVDLVAIDPQFEEYYTACKMIDQALKWRREDATTDKRSVISIALDIPALKCDPDMLPGFEVIVRSLKQQLREYVRAYLFGKAMAFRCKSIIDSFIEQKSGTELNDFLQKVWISKSLIQNSIYYVVEKLNSPLPETASLFARSSQEVFKSAIKKANNLYDWDLAVDTAAKFKSHSSLDFLYEELPRQDGKPVLEKLEKIWFGAAAADHQELVLRIRRGHNFDVWKRNKDGKSAFELLSSSRFNLNPSFKEWLHPDLIRITPELVYLTATFGDFGFYQSMISNVRNRFDIKEALKVYAEMSEFKISPIFFKSLVQLALDRNLPKNDPAFGHLIIAVVEWYQPNHIRILFKILFEDLELDVNLKIKINGEEYTPLSLAFKRKKFYAAEELLKNEKVIIPDQYNVIAMLLRSLIHNNLELLEEGISNLNIHPHSLLEEIIKFDLPLQKENEEIINHLLSKSNLPFRYPKMLFINAARHGWDETLKILFGDREIFIQKLEKLENAFRVLKVKQSPQ